MAPGRPSRRSTQQPKSYRVDQAYSFLYESGSEASHSSGERSGSERETSDASEAEDKPESDGDEFVVEEGEEEDPEEFQDMEMSDEDDDEGDGEVDDDHSEDGTSRRNYGNTYGSLMMGRGFGPGHLQPPSRFNRGGTKVRQRGLEDWVKGALDVRLEHFFGPFATDVGPAIDTRNHWHTQQTFPSRAAGDLHRSYWIPDGAHEKEVRRTREWYDGAGRSLFAAGQKVNSLQKERGQSYMTHDGPDSTNFLMGSLQAPQVYTLKKGEFMETAKPFGFSDKRRGWSFYLGGRIQEIQFVPNEEGNTQYLAVVVEQDPIAAQYEELAKPKAPAFSATEPFPASIQLWAFDSQENGDIDPHKPPRLEQVMCTDWGTPKALRWCPVGPNDSADSSDGTKVHLGLLASLWSDGKVRILDVSHRKSGPEVPETQYIHYSRAAFEIDFPETIPTCIHWLSGLSLAVATASGILAIWTLSKPNMFPSPTSNNTDAYRPNPWFYRQICNTYVLTLQSGYPSRPHYISTTTADGFDRLYDLRSPNLDSTFSSRGRMLVLTQAWYEHTQSFISPDEYYMLKHNTIRAYHKLVYSMRIPNPMTTCATSPVHPCILLGAYDGTVTASNSVMKIMNTKSRPFQIEWFKHEWRPPVDTLLLKPKPSESRAADEAPSSSANGSTQHPFKSPSAEILSQPLTRITEGYKAVRSGTGAADDIKRYKEGFKFITTFEKNSAISRLVWNPNLKFGTWAAAGTEGGYLRVEDLGD